MRATVAVCALAALHGLDATICAAFNESVVAACVGPVCSGQAVDEGIERPLVPVRARLGLLVRALGDHLAEKAQPVDIDGLQLRLQGTALILYLPFDGLLSLYVVSALFGLFQGGLVPAYPIIVREFFPPREAGAKVAIVLTATLLGMAFGGWLSGAIFDFTGSYHAAFINGIGWNLLNLSIAFWLLRRASVRRSLAAA